MRPGLTRRTISRSTLETARVSSPNSRIGYGTIVDNREVHRDQTQQASATVRRRGERSRRANDSTYMKIKKFKWTEFLQDGEWYIDGARQRRDRAGIPTDSNSNGSRLPKTNTDFEFK